MADFVDRIFNGAAGFVGGVWLYSSITSCFPTTNEFNGYDNAVSSLRERPAGSFVVLNHKTILGGDGIVAVLNSEAPKNCVNTISLRLEVKGDKFIYNQGLGFGRDLVIQSKDGKLNLGQLSFLQQNFLDRAQGVDAVLSEQVCYENDKVISRAKLKDPNPEIGRW